MTSLSRTSANLAYNTSSRPSFFSKVSLAIAEKPFTSQLLLCTFKTSCCDIMAQTLIEGEIVVWCDRDDRDTIRGPK